MSEVKRYEMKTTYRGHESWYSLEEDKDGSHVSYEDYAALESKLAQLLNELEASGKLIDTLRQDKDKVIDMSIERVNKLLSRAEAAEKRIAELESALNRHYELPDVYDMAINQFESLAKS